MIYRSSTPAPLVAALLTPGGRGAVATVRIEGNVDVVDEVDPPLFRAANGRKLKEQIHGRVLCGQWGTDAAEDVVVCRRHPTPATRHPPPGLAVDVHCHGGAAAAARILRDVERAGGRVVSWREMTMQHEGVFAAECVEALSRATTLRTASILLEQQSGAFDDAMNRLIDQLDANTDGFVADVDALLARSTFGLHLTEPWNVVLAGRPNVGKSSLLNALVGFSRSIVYGEPGTTRDVVSVETAFDGWPVRLSDTAGLRDTADEIESAGVERARSQLAAADCRVLLVDASREPHEDDFRLLADWPEAVVVAHKCDLPDRWGRAVPELAVRVSSLTGEGVEMLSAEIVSRLVPVSPASGDAIPFSARQVGLLHEARNAALDHDVETARKAVESCRGKCDGLGRKYDEW